MPQQATGNFYYPSDLSAKAGAIHVTSDGNDFYVPVAGTMTTGNTIGNVINQMTGNSAITQTSALVTTLPTSGNQADLFVSGYGHTALQVLNSGNPTATINFYGSADGANFIPVMAVSKTDGSVGNTATNLNNIYTIDTRGLQYLRTLVSNFSGSGGAYLTATGMSEGYGGSSHSVILAGTNVMQPVDLQGIYYKTTTGLDALPIYSPDGITIGAGTAFTASAVPVADFPMLYNNSNYDRMHNNFQASAIATTTSLAINVTGGTFTNYNARGVALFLSLNSWSGGTSPSLGFQVNTLDTASNKWFPLFSANAVTGTGLYQYQIYPAVTQNGLLAGAMNASLPRQWQVVSSLGGAPTSVSYSIGYNYIL